MIGPRARTSFGFGLTGKLILSIANHGQYNPG